MLSLVPGDGPDGSADAAQYTNTLGFFFLEKTDYSNLKRPEYIAIWTRTQVVVKLFIDKMLMDKADNEGMFCGFLAWLEEGSFSIEPIKALNSCNGYYVELVMKTNP